jgi:hypothetical protein
MSDESDRYMTIINNLQEEVIGYKNGRVISELEETIRQLRQQVAEITRLQKVIIGLAERVVAQSDILSKKAEVP